jgi:hypothetical protein
MRVSRNFPGRCTAALFSCVLLVSAEFSIASCDINSCKDSVCGKSNSSNGVNKSAAPSGSTSSASGTLTPTPGPSPMTTEPSVVVPPVPPATTVHHTVPPVPPAAPAAKKCHNTLSVAPRTGLSFNVGVDVACAVPAGNTVRLIAEIVDADGHDTTLDYTNPCRVHTGTQECPSNVKNSGITRSYFLISTSASQWAAIAARAQDSGYNASDLMPSYIVSDRYTNTAG